MSGNPITIRSLGPEDADVLDRVADGVFDECIDPARLWAFLATRVNDLVVALDRGTVVGFAYGTVLMRPDKPTEFVIRDVSVHKRYRRQAVARRLIERLRMNAADRGCEGVWVIAASDKSEAHAFYQALGGAETPGVVKYDWDVI